ncbi:Gastric triacylglycerol lipase [Halotydeus destructor]|nr:Gastric triacylglycerol lipase [Halotydeus destructor]
MTSSSPCILIAPAWDVRDSCPIANITTDHASRQYNSPDSTNVCDTSIEHITSSLAAWKPWSLPVLMVGHFLGALAYGFNRRTFSFTRLAVLCAHSSMRQSTKLYRQYMNSVKTGNLSKFDYGPFENETRYGSTTVPEYDLGSVTNQYISLVYSLGDVCVRPQGVLSVKSRLNSNIFHEYVIPDSEYTHLDFYMAPDVDVLVNKPVLDMLKRSLSDEPKLSAPSSG